MEHKILIVEDEQGIREAIGIYMRNQGYEVVLAENGEVGLQCASDDIHCAIVDIMMPVMDGITMTQKIRELYDFPIIFLSAKSEDIDKINGLMVGGDDYVTKPFASMELVARVKSQLRRYEQILELKNHHQKEINHDLLEVGGLSLNIKTKEVYLDGECVHLTPKEFQILELLMRHPGQVFSSEQIYETIWNEEAIATETIAVHIRRLREKIEMNPKKPIYIQVVWGVGYKMKKGEYV